MSDVFDDLARLADAQPAGPRLAADEVRRYAVVRTHASGARAASSRRRCDQARTNASCTHSCASSRSPTRAYTCPTSLLNDAA